MGERGLGDVEQRHQLADADLPGVLAQHVDELQPDRIAECLRDLRHAQRLIALDVWVDDGLAAGPAGGALLLGGQLKIDSHQSTYINKSYVCRCKAREYVRSVSRQTRREAGRDRQLNPALYRNRQPEVRQMTRCDPKPRRLHQIEPASIGNKPQTSTSCAATRRAPQPRWVLLAHTITGSLCGPRPPTPRSVSSASASLSSGTRLPQNC